MPPPATRHDSALPRARGLQLLSALLLLALVALIYLPVRHHAFVSYDDADYVTDNPHVLTGLNPTNITWAFTTGHASNWHPVTWLSHQLDCTLFGSSPTGPHLVNVVLHLANTALLLGLLHRLTAAFWPALAVVALFALHPLRVESVAWIAERKDVLSAFFFLLTLHAYTRYAALHSTPRDTAHAPRLWYTKALLLFALGLMSKPMLVTLPCVLLLLDLWPLRRLAVAGRTIPNTPVGHHPPSTLQPFATTQPLRYLVLEKLPFFALAAASCVITFLVQQRGGTVRSLESFSFSERAANAVVAIARYLEKNLWPTDLAVFYPHPGHWPFATVALSATLVLALTFSALLLVKRAPAFAVGWLWFLGMLIPTIGLVQVGNQSHADRYTYLPSIGLFIALIWPLSAVITHHRLPRPLVATVIVALKLACAFATTRQLPHWRDSEHLFTRALAVTDRNYVAHNGLGYLHLSRGQLDNAVPHFQRAVEIHPRFAEAHNNLGSALLQKDRPAEALASFQRAIAIQPSLAAARYNLGTLMHALGRPAEAISELQQAAALLPDDAVTRVNLGNALLSLSRFDEAAAAYREALRLQPAYADAHNNLGYVLLQSGHPEAAIAHFEQSVALQPDHANAYYNLGDAQRRRGRLSEAAAAFEKTISLQPTDAEAKALLDAIRQEIAHTRTTLTP